MGIFSVFNNVFDISIMPEFGAICGFTQQELESRFAGHIEETAQALRISPTALLDEMRDYYDGFCFDGETLVYNPFSVLQFFKVKKFSNFWFESGTPFYLADHIKDKRLTVEEFRGAPISYSFARNPGELDKASSKSFLYQAGYLSLRPGELEDTFTLDYSNREVLESMSRLLIENFFGSKDAELEFINLAAAFKARNPAGVVEEFNNLLASFSYADYSEANHASFEKRNPGAHYGESMYRMALRAFMRGARLKVLPEAQGSLGRADLVVFFGSQVWVLELKVSRSDSQENAADAALAEAAIRQIHEKGYAAPYKNPVLLALVINDVKRTITAWRAEGGAGATANPPASESAS